MIALNRARPLQLRNTFGFRINFQNQDKLANCKSQQRDIAYKKLQTGNIAFMKLKTGTQIISIEQNIAIQTSQFFQACPCALTNNSLTRARNRYSTFTVHQRLDSSCLVRLGVCSNRTYQQFKYRFTWDCANRHGGASLCVEHWGSTFHAAGSALPGCGMSLVGVPSEVPQVQ